MEALFWRVPAATRAIHAMGTRAMMGAEAARVGLRRLNPVRYIEAALKPKPKSRFGKVAVLEFTLYMRNQLLRDTDWASMAHSLEYGYRLVDTKLLSRLAVFNLGNGLQSKRLPGRKSTAAACCRRYRTPQDRFWYTDPTLAADG